MKRFNVTGNCIPEEDYMVDISGKIAEIEKLVDNCSYFTINKARQYGKTTTLYELRKRLASEYIVASISFQGLGDTPFESDENFCKSFADYMRRALRFNSVSDEYREKWASRKITNFDELSAHITDMCKGKKIVLMIDEVDQASNNRVFLHFLGMLREKYIARRNGDDYTFHSVILAGVYDIRGTNVNVSSHTVHAHTCIDKNIKLRLMKEGLYTPTENENKLYNSPWNIAVKFDVDMSFSPAEISTMLGEYETDHETGMDIAAISEEIYAYTSGYPFLVSR
ncbi:MAG: AAA-like domain-containing protein, partial [Oscillospiraceae bacterium]|nr:AAA-like domain-containing protein [Oscillospiraceae bacterium]